MIGRSSLTIFAQKSGLTDLRTLPSAFSIEAVRRVEDPEQRIISIHVEDQGDHVEISVINYYAGEVAASGGAVETTKADVNHHGFGTMSMKYITEQYGGHMGVDARGGIFRLFITIPKPKDAEKAA